LVSNYVGDLTAANICRARLRRQQSQNRVVAKGVLSFARLRDGLCSDLDRAREGDRDIAPDRCASTGPGCSAAGDVAEPRQAVQSGWRVVGFGGERTEYHRGPVPIVGAGTAVKNFGVPQPGPACYRRVTRPAWPRRCPGHPDRR
jgi:hypothetical protein